MKLKITPLLLFRIMFLLAIGICLLNVFKVQSVISISYVMMFPLVAVFAALVLCGNSKVDISAVTLIILIIIAVSNAIITLLLYGRGVSASELKKVIIFISTIVFFYSVNRIKVDSKTEKFIEILITFASTALVFLYFIKYNELYVYMTTGVKFLYFNFINPNFASMHFLVFGIFNLIFAQNQKKMIMRIMHWILALFMGFFVLATLSRNTIIIGVGFVLVYVLISFLKEPKLKYNRFLSIFVASWPLLFAIVYSLFITVINNLSFMSFLADEGKGLDSRVYVWNNAINEIKSSPLLGDYHYSLIRQSHNTHLDIWVSFGLIVLLITIAFIATIIYNKGREYASKRAYLCMLGFICCIVMGMAEAALFAGCQGLFVLIGTFILLSKQESDTVSDDSMRNRFDS